MHTLGRGGTSLLTALWASGSSQKISVVSVFFEAAVACQAPQAVCLTAALDIRPHTFAALRSLHFHSLTHFCSQPRPKVPQRRLWIRTLNNSLLARVTTLNYGAQLPPAAGPQTQRMSTGGISRKDFLWGISSRQHRQPEKPQKGEEEQTEGPLIHESKIDSLGEEGFASVQEALDRVILEAYRLLQQGRVDQAGYLLEEGMKTAISTLKEGHPILAQVFDQVALLQFLQGKFREAEQNALRSLEAVRQLPEDSGRDLAVAMCKLRLGTILLGLEQRAEAAAVLQAAHEVLRAAYGPEFQPVSEAAFFLTLAQLPSALSEEALTSVEDKLLQGLRAMNSSPGVGPHLMRAGMREHRALMDGAVDAQDWPLAEAILKQAIRMQEVVCPASDELALSTYQFGTLQYVRGLLEHAEQLCTSSLELSRRLYKKDSNNQVALRLHRLGTLHLAAGRTSEAEEALSQSCNNLIRNIGDANPLTGESRAALALAKLAQLDQALPAADPYTKILIPGRRRELVEEAREGLANMERGFGEQHMLVLKLRQIFNELALLPS